MKTFYNLKNNQIINIQHPTTEEALETLKIGLTESDYFISDENIEKTPGYTGHFDAHKKPIYEIKNNTIQTIASAEILTRNKAIYKDKISALSFSARQQVLPEYKQVNAALGVYDDTTKTKIKNCVEAFRAESYRLFGLIDAAETSEELETVLNSNTFSEIAL